MKQEKNKKRVMIFGVFDGCDKGHQYFLHEAHKFGNELVVVVARNETVEKLKGKCPLHTLNERIQAIKNLNLATKIIPGDKQNESWNVLKKYKPNIIVYGHDQEILKNTLQKNAQMFEFSFTTQQIKKHLE